LKITGIDPDGQLAGLVRHGDKLLNINGQPVRDIIDYRFLSAEDELELEFKRGGESYLLKIERDPFEFLGLEFAPMKPGLCGNDCLFCFVDQNPPGVRNSLKIKDEDYRFSFLYGNFITLSNLGKAGIDRIIRCRLSPLYVSVHAMNITTRNRLLNRGKDDGFHRKFRALIEGGIKLHTQVVIVPGCNDGEILVDTLEKLANFHPGVASIGLIPVGLTKYREGLPPLRPLTPAEASDIIELSNIFRERFTKELGGALVYCADEMFLLAGEPIPENEYYGDFPQLENGVGMARFFLDEFHQEAEAFPAAIDFPHKMLLVTGTAFAPFIEREVIPILRKIDGIKVELAAAPNSFFGETVTVAGLLAGRDILSALNGKRADLIVLPPDCLNRDGLFLDDLSLDEFQNIIGIRTIVFDSSFLEIFAYF